MNKSGLGWVVLERLRPISKCERPHPSGQRTPAGDPGLCSYVGERIRGFSTALRSGRNDSIWGRGGAGNGQNKQQQLPIQGSFTAFRMTSVWVMLKRAVELCSIPHPLQKAQRVGHSDLWCVYRAAVHSWNGVCEVMG